MHKAPAGILIGLGAAAIVLVADLLLTAAAGGVGSNALQTVELKTYDWRLARTARPETARQDIALVEIDEYSLRNLEKAAGRWPWPRVVHSLLLDYLARAPARIVAYDVLFTEPDASKGFDLGGATWTGAESDKALVESVKAAGNVLLLADATFQGTSLDRSVPPMADLGFKIDGPGVVERQVVFPPFGDLAAAAAGTGHNLVALDSDGPLRHVVPFVRSGGRAIPHLGLLAGLRVAGIPPSDVVLRDDVLRAGDRRMPLSRRVLKTPSGTEDYVWGLIDFRGPGLLADLIHRPYPKYSFYDLEYSEEQILAGAKPNIDPQVFRDKLVFVGVTATALYDVFETPFAGPKMPGIQMHAAVADDLLSNRFMREAPGRLATVVIAAVAVGVVATMLPAWWATLIGVALCAAFLWLATVLFSHGWWVNVTQPLLSGAFALFGGVAYQYFVEGREKRKMKKLFGQYVSRDVYEQLVANPALARLGGQRREMTVLFSDIRGFTTVSERGQPEEIVQMLNEYFTKMVELVFAHKGTVDKFVGDMVMALFGAPLDDPMHADHAVETALAMVEELQRLNRKWAAEGRPQLDIGIGINTGPMIAGNIGSDQIMSYTVIGDAVNLGSRLESLNKQYGTRIIISDDTRSRLAGAFRFRPLGEVVVKGKTQPVTILEVIGRAEPSSSAPEPSSPPLGLDVDSRQP